MAELDINAILATLDNLPRSTPNNPYYITPPVGNSISFSKPKIAQSNQPNFFNFPIPSSQPNMRNSILDTNNNQPNMSGANALTEKGLLNSLTPMPNNANNPNVPPNYKNNLLNLAVSPQGQAFVAGIDTRSSNVPMSIIERLQPGYQAYLKSKADQSKLAYDMGVANQNYELEKYKAESERMKANPQMFEDVYIDGKLYKRNKATNEISKVGGSDTVIKFGDSKEDKIFLSQFENDIKTVQKYQDVAMQSSDLANAYENMDRILANPDLDTGRLQEYLLPVKQYALSLGLLTPEQAQNVTMQTLLQSFASYVTPRMRPVGSGASSDFEQKLYGQSNVQLGNDINSNKLIVKARGSYARQNILFAEFADSFLRKNPEGFSMEALNKAFDEELFNNKDKLAYVLGTDKFYDNDDSFISAVKEGTLKVGDVYYNMDKNDNSYQTFKIVTDEMYQNIMGIS